MLLSSFVAIVYDGDGNRVSETVGTTTKFLVDDKNPTGLPQVLDEIVSGSVTRTKGYGGPAPLFRKTTEKNFTFVIGWKASRR